MTRPTIIIVDDHPFITEMAEICLSERGFTVRLASNAGELRGFLGDKANQPDLVVLDIDLPDVNGIELLAEIRFSYLLPILVFSAFADLRTIHACERNGASGFVGKSAKAQILIDGIEAVLSGMKFFPPKYMQELAKPSTAHIDTLNDRKERVLKLLIAGHRNKSIAHATGLAEGTIKNIVTELLQYFHVDSRQQLILAAHNFGYKVWPNCSS